VALLGDVLFSVRNKIPDLPPALPPPAASVTVTDSLETFTIAASQLVLSLTPIFIVTLNAPLSSSVIAAITANLGTATVTFSGLTIGAFANGNTYVIQSVGNFSNVAPFGFGQLIVYPITSGPAYPLTADTGTAAVSTFTGTLPAGTYCCQVTQRNNWGETISAGEFADLVVAAGQNISVTSALLPGAVAIRAYLTLPGGASGSEIQWVESATSPLVISAPLTGYGTPPTRSTAYLLDSDGPQFGASTLYSWLNEGLAEFSRIVGGILDYSGVPTLAGQSLYVCVGEWLEISDVWYDGYWVQGGKRAEFFRRNTVTTSILSRVTVSVMTNQQVIEVNYQPDRTAGVTATTNAMLTTDTQVGIANTGFSYLPFGFAQIGSEIVAYSGLQNGVMSGLIRSLGSSVAQAWPAGTPVTELSLFWCGKRLFNTKYGPGQSATVLQAPNGWAAILPIWMLAQAKKAEQDVDTAQKLEKQFVDAAEAWYRSNKGVARFVQVGGSGTPLTFNNTIAGGVIVPGI
jgi:hypothetical protein